MIDSSSHTLVCSVLFVDIPEYSKHSVAEQLQLKRMFNRILERALKSVSEHDRVLHDACDGAAATLLGPPEDALFAGLAIRENEDHLPARMGINLGPVRLMNDLRGQFNKLTSLGYQLVQDIEQAGSMWTAVCESNR